MLGRYLVPPRRKAVEHFDPAKFLNEVAAQVKKQAKQPNIHAYDPHEKQKRFHSSTARQRLYIGGNRSGKTTAGVAEAIWRLKGEHPYQKVHEPPIQGRTIGVDFLRGVESILKPQYKRWIPPSLLIAGSWDRSFSNETKTLTLTNGSVLEFMSYEQDTDKFAGVPRHFTHFDEEPPAHIYTECMARLIDYNGCAFFTMTPVEGMTWVYDKLYLPAIDGKSDVFIIEADMLDNPHISKEAADAFLSNLDEDERKARESGQFIQLGGLVFKKFDANKHVIPHMIPPKDWEWYESMDHGYNNPTAWLWHAVSPEGEVITFSEHYASEMVVEKHAEIVHNRRKALGKIADITVGDPAINQRNAIKGTSIAVEYAEHGVYIADGNNDVLIGINQMQDYLGINPKTGVPYWRITESCPNLIREMKRLRWKTWAGRKQQFENNKQEVIHKKDDHAADAARYFMTCLPTLEPDKLWVPEKELDNYTSPVVRYDQALAESLRAHAPARSTGWKDRHASPWDVWEGSSLQGLEAD